jgi:hypothetical protein
MDAQSNKKKSAHLKDLEEVFERHTRRFSPFAVLGLTPDEEEATQSPADSELTSLPATPSPRSDIPPSGSLPPPSGVEKPEPEGGLEAPSPAGSESPIHMVDPMDPPPPGSYEPTPVMEIATYPEKSASSVWIRPPEGPAGPAPRVGPEYKYEVVEVKNTTTQMGRTHGLSLSGPPMAGSQRPSHGSNEAGGISSNIRDRQREKAHDQSQDDAQALNTFRLADVVAAVQLGNQLGRKAREVLAYLNTMRSSEYEAYTLPVGYGQISAAVGVDADYLRRKVLPKLAMLGLIAVTRKSLEGTIYHLLYPAEYVKVVTERIIGHEKPTMRHVRKDGAERQDALVTLPEWIDREQWGWLSGDHVRRLVEKSGSEARARENLDIILYNEEHGPPERRVRNRRSVLMHYLTSPEAEIWPNDNGFETLEMRRASVEKEQALREKALVEEALQARREVERLRFLASLSEAQLRWLRQEAKRRVDAQPASNLLKSRYPLYKAEEERLVQEWMDRSAYGESMPDLQE